MDGNCTRVCKGFLSAPTNDTYVRLCIMLSRFIEIEGSLKAIYLNYTAKFNSAIYVCCQRESNEVFPNEEYALQSMKEVKKLLIH